MTAKITSEALRAASVALINEHMPPSLCTSTAAVSLQLAADEIDRLRAALETLDQMNPNDFQTGQGHLTPAFREPDLGEAMRFVCRTVNGVLHGTDEHGDPL